MHVPELQQLAVDRPEHGRALRPIDDFIGVQILIGAQQPFLDEHVAEYFCMFALIECLARKTRLPVEVSRFPEIVNAVHPMRHLAHRQIFDVSQLPDQRQPEKSPWLFNSLTSST